MSFKDFLKRSFNLKIFSLNRIQYEQLWFDALDHIRQTYDDLHIKFNSSSPFAQLLSVILHLGRMILYYIEDSITGLNIKTAWRPQQIQGLATLTGHDPARAVAARAAIRLTYNGSDDDLEGQTLYIPNKTEMINLNNAQGYVIMFGAENAKITLKRGNYVNANIIQGTIHYQSGTSDGMPLQSFNFAERNYSTIDQYYINVYVNGEPWEICNSLIDLGYQQHACVVKTGQTGGIDVFFGNGDMGAIPQNGAIILCEYLVTSGEHGNLNKNLANSGLYWDFKGPGYLSDGTSEDLNNLFTVTCLTDAMFGNSYENIVLTREIAPYTSRSFVLGNATNYKYFLKKLNLFSIIDVIQGFNTEDDAAAEKTYQQKQYQYTYIRQQFENSLSLYGDDADLTAQLKADLDKASKELKQASIVLKNSKMDDNTVYLFLIPDIKNRIPANDNYFTCNEETAFKLTKEEKYNILNLIDMSGQSIIAVENKILAPRYPRFAINIQVRIWNGYTYNDIYGKIIDSLSDYFIKCKRRDRIPLSDIISLVEKIEGIDSVSAYFDADKNNYILYNSSEDFNGIDDYGDIVLERTVINSTGNSIQIRDLYPLFRGGFTNTEGLTYSSEQSSDQLSAVNVSLIGYSNENNPDNVEHALIN